MTSGHFVQKYRAVGFSRRPLFIYLEEVSLRPQRG